ncbi:HAMP domain-containing protein [Deinococcus yavapaiensis]|uniref:histidine kinase n=1 Tax=Deinococcus yavapaiensis KR-236 TaxID=694435 RepID=A0A318S8C6_9DEIO|nr:HAMP domain-containing protein [Deinococcus yavapaiensis]PYE54785.1 HAMP domain-containing protein [Deinococcus yavapaiensis KR-236]
MTATPSTLSTPARRQRKLSLRAKLLIGFTLIFTVVFAAAFYWFYWFSTENALARIRQDLVETAAGAAANIDGENLSRLAASGKANKAGFSDDPRYKREIDEFQRIHAIEPRAWPYTYVRGTKENEIVWMTDLWSTTDDVRRAVQFKDTFVSKGNLWRGLTQVQLNMPRNRRGADLSETFWGRLGLTSFNPLGRVGYEDEWGKWVSAYHPILDSKGQVVGAVGIDFTASEVDDVQNAILGQVALVFAMVYLVLFFLVYIVSGVLTRPITVLTAAAEKVGDGDYNQDFGRLVRVRTRDEIVVLAQVLTGMTEKVREREQSLRREVLELRIEIDQAKKEKQVKEIVDTDFFRDLKGKAASMRARASQPRADESDTDPREPSP